MDDNWPRSRAYVLAASSSWVAFLAAVGLLTWGTSGDRFPNPLVLAIVIVAAGLVGAQFLAAYRLVARQDEFMRGITVKRMLAAAGVTITVAVVWGLAQQFLALPQAPVWLVYPLFWGALGVVTPLIRTSHP